MKRCYVVQVVEVDRLPRETYVYMSKEKAREKFMELIKDATDDEGELNDANELDYYDTDESETIMITATDLE